jgi:hypothetical protein
MGEFDRIEETETEEVEVDSKVPFEADSQADV